MNEFTYNAVDLVVLAIVVWETIMGLRRRMAGELFRLLCTVFVLGVAWKYYLDFGAVLAEHTRLVDNPDMASAIAFTMLVTMLGLGCALLHLILGLLVKVEFNAGIDRLGGALFGLLRGVLVAVLLVFAAGLWPPAPMRSLFREQALTGRLVQRVAPPIIKALRSVHLNFKPVAELPAAIDNAVNEP
ncbi:MAG: CvpA family protein [Lentisphaerae bacterium]|nr:CvpA family protein [Lentisphaerota bacterium]